MSNNNLNQTIEGIESKLTFYVTTLDELRTFINKFEQLDKFYKTINEGFNLGDVSTFINQLNFSGYLTISILDLLVICKNILATKYQWERIHQLKLGCMVIYEAIATFHRHKEINKLAKNDIKSAELHKLISSDLKTFKNDFDYPNTFIKIRNVTIAHIDANFKTYYDTVSKIDGNKYFQAILSFLQILFKMEKLSRYLSENLILQKDGEHFNMDKLVNETTEKINMRLNELK